MMTQPCDNCGGVEQLTNMFITMHMQAICMTCFHEDPEFYCASMDLQDYLDLDDDYND